MPWRTHDAAFRKEDGEFYDHLGNEAVRGSRSGIDTWARQFFFSDEEGSEEPLQGKKRGDKVVLGKFQ
jgi:hypothetical protein